MLERILPGRPHRPEGATIDRVRAYGMVNAFAFLGRRRRVYRRLADLSGARPGDRVLDVGCSGGYLARILAARVGADGRVTGVDPSEKAIAYANRHAPRTCTFTVGVAQALDLPDGSFDVVTSTLALHHIPEAKRPTALAEMHRVLRPGGRLLLADFRPSGHYKLLHGWGPHRSASPTGGQHHSSVSLDDVVGAAGFQAESAGDLPMLRYVRAVRS